VRSVSEYNANSEAQFTHSRKRLRPGGRGQPPKPQRVSRKRKSVWRISFTARRAPQRKTNWLRKEYSTYALPSSSTRQPCQRYHAGAFLLRRLQAVYAGFQFPDGALSRSDPETMGEGSANAGRLGTRRSFTWVPVPIVNDHLFKSAKIHSGRNSWCRAVKRGKASEGDKHLALLLVNQV